MCTTDVVSLPPAYVSSLTFWLYFVGFVKTMIYVKSARNNQRIFTMMSTYSSSSNTQQHSILPSHSSCMNSISDLKTRSNWQSRRISGKNAHYTVKVYTCTETKRSGYYIFGIKKNGAMVGSKQDLIFFAEPLPQVFFQALSCGSPIFPFKFVFQICWLNLRSSPASDKTYKALLLWYNGAGEYSLYMYIFAFHYHYNLSTYYP